MTSTIKTIDELKSKPVRELHAIFREATAIASSYASTTQEREAARKTIENVRKCLCQSPCPLGPQ